MPRVPMRFIRGGKINDTYDTTKTTAPEKDVCLRISIHDLIQVGSFREMPTNIYCIYPWRILFHGAYVCHLRQAAVVGLEPSSIIEPGELCLEP